MRIPKHIVEEHKKGVEDLRFYGHPVEDLDHDELLAFANLCAQTIRQQRQRIAQRFIDNVLPLARYAEECRARYAELGITVNR